ncbi:pyruvate ferredoxin oxidoreductase [Anaerotruncus sp. AF02-27]|uniref:transketolase C-terminal domain-containing protein n=1 Tax=Anaerotruncus sp. AF02-27 TaxID=2292191 RepID=UPI000E47AE45|nr:transketolase C-terminal domain-containing protein [Anaerotruncus sp. AF02-27]RGX55834.1 pyruvate ferredoxin oxidoreductase [Anaerotruncus sp. AF02-27]
MGARKLLDGNMAMVEAMKRARVGVISAYPITPQSPVAEKLSEYVADDSLKAEYIRVESEHTALSCAIGAQLTGVRACTATSSVGLALMHEVLGIAAGCRVPIVMGIINRALVAPWSLWCDHQDAMAERDSGWIQIYAESVQEVFDYMIYAYKLAEHEDVLLPAMVCQDGFFLSHTAEIAMIPDQETVDSFLPAYISKNTYLDVNNPMFINNLTPSSEFGEMRRQQKDGFDAAKAVAPAIMEEFEQAFGRKLHIVEAYRCDDADVALVTIGSMSGTAKHTVDMLREEGKKVGVLRLVFFRPFPHEMVREALKNVPTIGVLDRSAGLGAQGAPVYVEVKAAAGDCGGSITSLVGGLGGRDISVATIKKAFDHLYAVHEGRADADEQVWVDVRADYNELRRKIGGND